MRELQAASARLAREIEQLELQRADLLRLLAAADTWHDAVEIDMLRKENAELKLKICTELQARQAGGAPTPWEVSR
jgi:hypothetical protein